MGGIDSERLHALRFEPRQQPVKLPAVDRGSREEIWQSADPSSPGQQDGQACGLPNNSSSRHGDRMAASHIVRELPYAWPILPPKQIVIRKRLGRHRFAAPREVSRRGAGPKSDAA